MKRKRNNKELKHTARLTRFVKRAAGKAIGAGARLGASPDRLVNRLFRENRNRLLELENTCRNQRVFIIGNGPSLERTDLARLNNEITIGCNGLFLIFGRLGFLPTFYTVEDTLVAEERAARINEIHGPIKIFPFDVRSFLKPDTKTAYVSFLRNYPGFPRFSRRIDEKMFWGGTVTYMNLQLAYYLGAREVFLVGIDHFYHEPVPGDRICGTVIESSSADRNHMHPDYFGPGYRYHDPRVDRMEVGYKKAAGVYRAAGRRIYNATAGGRLEIFERVNYNSLF